MESLTKRIAAWPAWSRWLLLALILAGYFGAVGLMAVMRDTGGRLLVLLVLGRRQTLQVQQRAGHGFSGIFTSTVRAPAARPQSRSKR